MSRRLAARGEMALQRCDACEVMIYPPREICPNCLSGEISWCAFDGAGEILARSILSHSFDPVVAAKLPLAIVSVKLDAGPVVIAFADSEDMRAGDRVSLTLGDNGPALLAVNIEGGDGA